VVTEKEMSAFDREANWLGVSINNHAYIYIYISIHMYTFTHVYILDLSAVETEKEMPALDKEANWLGVSSTVAYMFIYAYTLTHSVYIIYKRW